MNFTNTKHSKVLRLVYLSLLLLLIVCFVLFAWMLNSHKTANSRSITRQSTLPKTDSQLRAGTINVPQAFQVRAKSLGYYCPSWAAKPGEIVPTICYKLNN
jgi:flagellar basal body-associated protein FliL